MEVISLKKVSKESKITLLKELGYDSDGIYVLKDGRQDIDEYVNEPVKLDNMIIVPGSALVLDDNPLSIATYFEKYGELL